ncbi:MAG: Cna B-type domain-containing protein, partial [Lachnospiraceae bacterium]|nr:Cna B-type domain-containing protein [Lachnospiraceae bacterium]
MISDTQTAEVDFSDTIVPRGNGKAWFNCQGGETHDGNTDIDYLEVKKPKSSGTGFDYLKLGEGGDIDIPGWTYNDIAKPNLNQTPPSGLNKFNNCFSFGLSSFTGLQGHDAVTGVRKRMLDGNDCFGSIMLLVEVMPAEGTVEVTKKLMYDGGGVNDVLPNAGVQRTLTFHVEPTGDAPMPFRIEGEGEAAHEVPNQDFSINFPANTHSGDEVLFEMGNFRFRGQDIPDSANSSGPWYFTYEVTETSATNMYPWIYDTRTLLLTFKVVVNEENEFEIEDHTWSVKDHPEDEINYFKNDYILPLALEVKKVDMTGAAISGAKFMVYSDANCTTVASLFINEAKTTALTATNAPATDSEGKVIFYGLDKEKTYYIREESVPSPYILDQTVITVAYDEEDDRWEYSDGTVSGQPLDPSVSSTTDLGIVTLTRQNNEYVSVYADKAWVNADGTTTAPNGASVVFTLYADGTATGYTVTLNGSADTEPTGTDIAGYESEAWKAKFINLPKYQSGTSTAIVYTIGETTGYPGYTKSPANPVASGGTITNSQEETTANALKKWKNADGSTTAPSGASVVFKLYADGVATSYTVTLDGEVDVTIPEYIGGY